ncbi:MAG: NAD(P)H-dependent oxidoreductase [Planctomycetales bacterium]|nr:NAD(P)H-dependent oxidoreductase [Planctomycetales bacterium]MBN8624162.1 NAD(P)H-dependent oxidoreductase [Planctomycetota bacterium]
MPSKILAFAGSLRKDSFNKKLVRIAVEGARAAGAEVTLIELNDFPLPIFDQDLEATSGMPEAGRKLKQLFLEHDGLLIASPEYNSSITPLLKNTIDWVSRVTEPGEPGLKALAGKTAAIIAASPGALGGLRGLVTLRSILGNIQITVLPDQIAVPQAGDAFNDDGSLKDPKKQEGVRAIGRKLAEVAAKLKS